MPVFVAPRKVLFYFIILEHQRKYPMEGNDPDFRQNICHPILALMSQAPLQHIKWNKNSPASKASESFYRD